MRRREFITLVGGMASAWPLAVRAQQSERMRRIGVFQPGVADDSEYEARNAAFLQTLGQLGWIVGRNLRIDFRWGAGNADNIRKYAAELVALAPDAILASGGSSSGHWYRRPAPYRSCFRLSPIRWAPAWSKAWRGRAATSPVS
jgi:putative tryptophan/tyrosine transport system substrate-binding protein